jgi:hypothetical protein
MPALQLRGHGWLAPTTYSSGMMTKTKRALLPSSYRDLIG